MATATATAKGWERYLDFRCTGCGNCCRGTYIIITDGDLRRLVDGTRRDPLDIVRFVNEDDIRFDKRHPWWIRFARRRAVMVLRWEQGRCTFLGDDNMCGAYAHRPLVCRMHPFDVTLAEVDRGAVEKISLSRLVHCPHEWDGHNTRRDLAALERWMWREHEPYCEKVAAWNKRRDGVRTPREFLRYLGF